MEISLLSKEQLKDLARAGQTDILHQESIYTMLVIKTLDYDKERMLVRSLFNYMELVELHLS